MEKKLKVALMSYAMDNRTAKGTALYTKKLIMGLLANGNFDFYLVHYEKTDDPLYTNRHEIIIPKVKLPFASHFISQLLFFWKYRKEPFDVIHWFQPRLYPFYWLAPAKKIIVTMHGAGDVTAPKGHFVLSRTVFNFVLKYLHHWVDASLVVSNNAKEEVVQYYGFSPDRIFVTYNGGGEDFIAMNKNIAGEIVAKKYDITNSYIFDLSRLIPHKNIATLIAAYTLLRKKYPSHKEKLIVGGATHPSSDEYAERDRSAFSKDIIFIDFVPSEDLNAMYSAAELFVFPSLSEGFGLPVLEAMASGTPVITSNVTSMPEIGGEAVITVSPHDTYAISEAMHTVLSDGNVRSKMVELGLARAKEFTWAKTVEETEKIYEGE